MQIIPAIDIRDGKVVRLRQGKAHDETVYSDSPLDVAMKLASYGVGLIHIVDLDGALEGELQSLDIVREIASKVKSKIELGGGIRDVNTIRRVLDAGVEKVVIGTKALDEKFISKVTGEFGANLVVGIDAHNGIVHTKGWLFKTTTKAIELVKKIKDAGIQTINYTDISRDGMMAGPNFESLTEVLKAADGMRVIASGGVSTMNDVLKLRDLEDEGLYGMIIGKAIYEKKIDLGKAIKSCTDNV